MMPSNKIPWKCPACDLRVNVPANGFPIHCLCGYTQMQPVLGLGDRIAAALHRCGLTKRRYVRAKAAIGLKGDCNCLKRQNMLNRLGNKIGL